MVSILASNGRCGMASSLLLKSKEPLTTSGSSAMAGLKTAAKPDNAGFELLWRALEATSPAGLWAVTVKPTAEGIGAAILDTIWKARPGWSASCSSRLAIQSIWIHNGNRHRSVATFKQHTSVEGLRLLFMDTCITIAFIELHKDVFRIPQHSDGNSG